MQGTIQVNSGKALGADAMGLKAGKRRQERAESSHGFECFFSQCLVMLEGNPSKQTGIPGEAAKALEPDEIPIAGKLTEEAAKVLKPDEIPMAGKPLEEAEKVLKPDGVPMAGKPLEEAAKTLEPDGVPIAGETPEEPAKALEPDGVPIAGETPEEAAKALEPDGVPIAGEPPEEAAKALEPNGVPIAGKPPEMAEVVALVQSKRGASGMPAGGVFSTESIESIEGKKDIPEVFLPEVTERAAGNVGEKPVARGVRALVETWVSTSGDPQDGEIPKGFLLSAKGQSLLNRMAEISGEAAGTEAVEPSGGGSVFQEMESGPSKQPDVPLKGFLTEDGQLKRPGRPEEKTSIPEAALQATEKGEAPAKGLMQRTAGASGGAAIENPEEIVETLRIGIQKLREDGKVVMRVRLKPEELGSIDMRLAWEAGVVKGRILVENESVREQLQTLLAEDRLFGGESQSRPVAIEVAVDRQAGGFAGAFEERARDFGSRRESGRSRGETRGKPRIERPEAAIPRAGRPSGLDLLA